MTESKYTGVWTGDRCMEEVYKVIAESEKKEMVELKNANKWLYMDAMVKKFDEFYTRYGSLFAKVAMGLDEKDMKTVTDFCAMKDRIKNGEISRARGEFILGLDLAKNYDAEALIDPNKQMPD